MSEKSSPNVNAEAIAHFLQRTGFVFEMRANEVLLKAGFATEFNDHFVDLEENIIREIDIIATKVVNEINIHFVIECKQSVTDKWIFICNKKMPRFYRAVKHLPSVSIEVLKDRELFSGFHVFNRKIPLGHNYLASFKAEKKAEHLQIDECIHKLPKALVDFAARSEAGRHLFFPVALFAGQIFAVSYRGKLVVEEVPFLQYYVKFDKETYRSQPPKSPDVLGALIPAWAEYEKWATENRNDKIRKVAIDLAFPYQIDVVTETGFQNYLALIEKQVMALHTADWPIPNLQSEQKP